MIHLRARTPRLGEEQPVAEAATKRTFAAVLIGFAVTTFLVTESMHLLLVPDVGRHIERMIAEAVSAVIVGFLVAKLFESSYKRRQVTLARIQVISEMNHHIRNALSVISLSTREVQNKQAIRVITEALDHIEWTLSEILPRQKPLPEKERNRLFYFAWRHRHD